VGIAAVDQMVVVPGMFVIVLVVEGMVDSMGMAAGGWGMYMIGMGRSMMGGCVVLGGTGTARGTSASGEQAVPHRWHCLPLWY
jgi:hypothetical protein